MANWENLPSTATPLNASNLETLYSLKQGSNNIAANTDLNTLTTPGTYRCVSRANAETLTNSPYTIGYFKLIVENISSNDGDHIRQTILTGARNTYIYIRTNDANGWGEWHQVANTDNSYHLGVGKPITSGTDLNNMTTIGTYYSLTDVITNSLVNCPIKHAGFKLIVENTTGTYRTVQTIKVNNAKTSATYVRTYIGSWGEWNIVMTGNYSTSERIIGTWISGKPTYRRVFTSTSFESTYNTGITNVNEIVDFKGFVYRKDYPNMVHTIPSRFSKSGYEIDLESLAKNSGGLQVAISWGSSLDATKINKVVFVIEYTKTTD